MKNVIVSGPLVFSEQNCPNRVGEIINSISEIYDIPNPRVGMLVYVKNEGKNYTITGLREKTIEGVVVPNAQVDTYRCMEAELLNRIQGTSEDSDAERDPFKFIGNYDSFEALIEKLDTMHGSVGETAKHFNGRFRAKVGSKLVEIFNEVQGYVTDVWSQRITCAGIVLRNEVLRTEEEYSQYSSESTHKYRLHRYKQKFVNSISGGENFDIKGGVKTFCRRHYLTGNNVSTWTPWYDVENPYVQTQNYGKKIALFGASFAQNFAVSGYEFAHEGTFYNLADYIAEKLGAVAFDDYAVGGQGMRCDDNSPFPVHLMNQLKTAQSKSIYDIYIIMGGVNDYWCDKVPLGESTGYASGSSNDDKQNISYCGGLLKAIDYIRVNAPNAKIYTITPFKGYNAEWGWNPRTKIRNAYGNTFYEFVQAQKEVSQVKGVPCLDLWAMQGFSGANAPEHYISDLLHPNGNGYYKASEKIVEFVAHGVGSEVVDVQALGETKGRFPSAGMQYIILQEGDEFHLRVTQENTIYEIRYDFDLGGHEVTIPENCVLKFEGGSVSNGTLVGTQTRIINPSNAVIFKKDVKLYNINKKIINAYLPKGSIWKPSNPDEWILNAYYDGKEIHSNCARYQALASDSDFGKSYGFGVFLADQNTKGQYIGEVCDLWFEYKNDKKHSDIIYSMLMFSDLKFYRDVYYIDTWHTIRRWNENDTNVRINGNGVTLIVTRDKGPIEIKESWDSRYVQYANPHFLKFEYVNGAQCSAFKAENISIIDNREYAVNNGYIDGDDSDWCGVSMDVIAEYRMISVSGTRINFKNVNLHTEGGGINTNARRHDVDSIVVDSCDISASLFCAEFGTGWDYKDQTKPHYIKNVLFTNCNLKLNKNSIYVGGLSTGSPLYYKRVYDNGVLCVQDKTGNLHNLNNHTVDDNLDIYHGGEYVGRAAELPHTYGILQCTYTNCIITGERIGNIENAGNETVVVKNCIFANQGVGSQEAQMAKELRIDSNRFCMDDTASIGKYIYYSCEQTDKTFNNGSWVVVGGQKTYNNPFKEWVMAISQDEGNDYKENSQTFSSALLIGRVAEFNNNVINVNNKDEALIFKGEVCNVLNNTFFAIPIYTKFTPIRGLNNVKQGSLINNTAILKTTGDSIRFINWGCPDRMTFFYGNTTTLNVGDTSLVWRNVAEDKLQLNDFGYAASVAGVKQSVTHDKHIDLTGSVVDFRETKIRTFKFKCKITKNFEPYVIANVAHIGVDSSGNSITKSSYTIYLSNRDNDNLYIMLQKLGQSEFPFLRAVLNGVKRRIYNKEVNIGFSVYVDDNNEAHLLTMVDDMQVAHMKLAGDQWNDIVNANKYTVFFSDDVQIKDYMFADKGLISVE